MTHPVSELALACAVVVTVGAGALAVMPPQSAITLAIKPEAPAVLRAEPLPPQTDAERIDVLQRQLAEVSAEQKRLIETLRAEAPKRRRP